MTLFVAPIVEGETEERCIKILLSRIWGDLLQSAEVEPLAVLDRSSVVVFEANPRIGKSIG